MDESLGQALACLGRPGMSFPTPGVKVSQIDLSFQYFTFDLIQVKFETDLTMQSQDAPSYRPPPITHPQDQLNSCKLSASCSRPVVSSALPNTPHDTPQNLLLEEPHVAPQKHQTKPISPPVPQGQLNSCKLSANRPSVVPKIPPRIPQTSPQSPPTLEELDFQDVKFKSTDIRLRQPKEHSTSAHQPLVNTAVKAKVTITVFTFYIYNSF